jgi:hypothetical protein
MQRYLLPIAIVLAVLATARQVLSLSTVVLFMARDMAEPFAWRHVVGVFWSLVALAWTALVSYAAVHVCRRIATESATAPR